jgi:cell division protein FtsB
MLLLTSFSLCASLVLLRACLLHQDKSAAAIKKSEKDKQALSDKYNQAQLNVIAMYEEVRGAHEQQKRMMGDSTGNSSRCIGRAACRLLAALQALLRVCLAIHAVCGCGWGERIHATSAVCVVVCCFLTCPVSVRSGFVCLLSSVSSLSQRQAERVELEKLQRQNTVLTSLCKELKSKLNNTTAVTSTPSAAVSGEAPATAPVDDEDAAAAATATAPTPAQAEPAAVES